MLVRAPKASTSTPPVGGGGAPSIGAVVTQSVAGTAMSFAIPGTIANGELMLLLIGCYGTCPTPSGWTLQQEPPTPAGSNGYIFSRVKVSGDTAVAVTISATDSHTGALVGIKNGLTVHKNSSAIEIAIQSIGTTTPSVTTTVANTLNIWFSYTNSNVADSNLDVAWAPDKPRAAVVSAPVAANYYGVLSVVSKAQATPGDSEVTKVSTPIQRNLASLNLISIAP